MFYNGKKVVCLEWVAEGYYSSRRESELWFMTEEMYEMYEEDVAGFVIGYSGIDGKHSYCEGELSIHLQDIDIAKAYIAWDGSYDKVHENILDLEDAETLVSFNDEMLEALSHTRKDVVTLGDSIIYES